MKFVTLTFDRDHTHAGKPIKRGENCDVPQYTADWLIAHDVAHPAAAARTTQRSTPDADAGQFIGIPSEPSHEEDDDEH